MAINGNLIRYILDGLFIALIGTFGWVASKADAKVEKHDMRIQAVELTNMRVETKLDYLIKSFDEVKANLRKP